MLCSLSSSRNPRYLSQTRLQHDVEWRTLLELNKEYNVSAANVAIKILRVNRLLLMPLQKKVLPNVMSECSEDDLERVFSRWFWIIFDWLPLPHIVCN